MTERWALVTGASDGIGAVFARLLAERGYHLVLVARREPLLRQVAEAAAQRHGVRSEILVSDLSKAGAAEALHRETSARGIAPEVLVNNAGLLHNGYFHQIERTKHEDLLAVNITALTSLTHLFVNDMIERRRGRILNVASLAAWMPLPQQNVYAASKAYVLAFTLALNDELRALDCGVTATALCPSYTDTKMLDNPEQGKKLAIPKALILDTEMVARDGINACLAGKAMVTPGMSNQMTAGFLQCLPKLWVARVAGMLYRRGQS